MKKDDINTLLVCSKSILSKIQNDTTINYLTYLSDTKLKELFKLANRHGVLMHCYKYLNKTPQTSHILSLIKPLSTYTIQRQMLLSKQLLAIDKLFKQHNIPYIILKGPAISTLLYQDIISRQFTDIDILINKQHIKQAIKLLSTLNYQLDYDKTVLNNPKLYDVCSDIGLQDTNHHTSIELHWQLIRQRFSDTLSSVDLFNDTQTIQIHNKSFTTLSNEIYLIYLCMHGSKHLWQSIKWIIDIDQLIQKHDINWQKVTTYTSQFQAKSSLALGLSLAYELYNTPIPSEFQTTNKRINRLKHITKQQLYKPSSNTLYKKLLKFYYHANLKDTYTQQLLYYLKLPFGITPDDVLFINISKPYQVFYFLIRPLRLSLKLLGLYK